MVGCFHGGCSRGRAVYDRREDLGLLRGQHILGIVTCMSCSRCPSGEVGSSAELRRCQYKQRNKQRKCLRMAAKLRNASRGIVSNHTRCSATAPGAGGAASPARWNRSVKLGWGSADWRRRSASLRKLAPSHLTPSSLHRASNAHEVAAPSSPLTLSPSNSFQPYFSCSLIDQICSQFPCRSFTQSQFHLPAAPFNIAGAPLTRPYTC